MTTAPRSSTSFSLREFAALAVVVTLGAIGRLVDLATRGDFDRDQGHDMLILVEAIATGQLPLVGPPMSTGGHHGVLYYLLLLPAALPGRGLDPVAVTVTFAMVGLLAVVATWWLGREVGGPVAGWIAGVLAASSAMAVVASTTIWNPHLIPAASAIAVASAIRARRTGHRAWWLLAGAAVGVAAQAHSLGLLVAVPVGVLFALTIRATVRDKRTALARAGGGALALAVLGYLPMLVYEIETGFENGRAILAFLGSAGLAEPTLDPIGRLLLASIRIAGWPLAGPIATTLVGNVLALALLVGAVAVLARTPTFDRATLGAFVAALLAGAIAITVLVPRPTANLAAPTDHYHIWLDPLVLALVAIAAARPWASPTLAARWPRVMSVLVIAGIVAWNVVNQPPAIHPEAWPETRAAADRILSVAGDTVAITAAPPIRPDAYEYALTVAGRAPTDPLLADTFVVVCDARYRADCGDAVALEQADLILPGRAMEPVLRFEAPADRLITVFRVVP